jgi:hypothetical protein
VRVGQRVRYRSDVDRLAGHDLDEQRTTDDGLLLSGSYAREYR